MNAADFRDLTAAVCEFRLAKLCGVHVTTFRRWKRGQARIPEPAVRLISAHLDGDLAALFGDEWKDFRIGKDGRMYAPFHHRSFEPRHIVAMFFGMQELHTLRRERFQLLKQIEDLQTEKMAHPAPFLRRIK